MRVGVLSLTVGVAVAAHHHHRPHRHHEHGDHRHHATPLDMRFRSGSGASTSAPTVHGAGDPVAYESGEKPGPCWVVGESVDCCPNGWVETGKVEDCIGGKKHGSSLLGRHCKSSAEHEMLSMMSLSKKKKGHRAICSNDPGLIQRMNDEAKATAQKEKDMAEAARQQQADDEVAAANSMLSSTAPPELCRAFQNQAGLCTAAGCQFVGTPEMTFRSNDLSAKCNLGCCPTGVPREGTAPTPGVCAALRSNAALCVQAGCIHRAAPMFHLFSRSKCIVPGSDTGVDGASIDGNSDLRLMGENQLPGEDIEVNTVNNNKDRMQRLKDEVVEAENKIVAKTPADPTSSNPNPVVTPPLREKIMKGLNSISQWIAREKHGCRTGIFAKWKGQRQPETCQACVQSSVGGLFTSSNLCSWCALDGHSTTIGFCAASPQVCHKVQTKAMREHFGENVAFTTVVSHYNEWQCPDIMEAQVRSCKRGCALRCEVEPGKKDWAQQQKRPTEAKCIAPEACEGQCKAALLDQLEMLMFEERVARTVPAMTTNLQLCIRGCTDRKVGFAAMDTGLHAWEFEEIEKSGSTCLDQCDLTIRGTITAEKQVALNDAELGVAGSDKQEAVKAGSVPPEIAGPE